MICTLLSEFTVLLILVLDALLIKDDKKLYSMSSFLLYKTPYDRYLTSLEDGTIETV